MFGNGGTTTTTTMRGCVKPAMHLPSSFWRAGFEGGEEEREEEGIGERLSRLVRCCCWSFLFNLFVDLELNVSQQQEQQF